MMDVGKAVAFLAASAAAGAMDAALLRHRHRLARNWRWHHDTVSSVGSGEQPLWPLLRTSPWLPAVIIASFLAIVLLIASITSFLDSGAVFRSGGPGHGLVAPVRTVAAHPCAVPASQRGRRVR
jgi:hypothetical protein